MPTDTIFSHPLVLSVILALPLMGIIAKLFRVSSARIAKWYLYVSVFAVVIVMDSIFFPFIGGKDYFFRFCIELSLIFFVLWWAFEAKKGELGAMLRDAFKKPLVIAVTAFLVAFHLACVFGYDFHASFWSNYERGEGGFQMIHYYLFFILLVLFMKKESDWRNIFKCSLVAAGLMIIYGIFGNYGVNTFIGPYAGAAAPVGWWHTLIDGRFEGSLGNPAYVAPYLVFSMFFAAYLWLWTGLSGRAAKLAAWGWGILIAIFLFFFILSQTRGAFIGLAAGIFVLVLYFIIAGKGNLRKWSSITLGILVVLGIGLYAIRNVPAVKNLPEGRLLQISLSDTTAQTRLWVWAEAWHGFLERPVFGWGPENFTTVFDKYFNPNFFVPAGNTQTWFDRAHSVYFDYLTETGIVGLLAYLSIFFIFFMSLFKHHRRARRELDGDRADHKRHNLLVLERGMIFAVLVAYLVQGIAIFDVFPMYLALFLFLGFDYYYFYVRTPHHPSHHQES